ncbi:hypothetical protein [Rhodohalobacter mucosus]|uniref:Uncharacterized protein n=1 Tax=Rhodohalobacter mucosus TaxID=2079485 RepID=A0A316TU82_9BACT|nr:hypothetical protein [Rhodohalobacter mucosus]PWN07378.1 hypothetical protein DDZ15_03690 [Rhodohalobacter mucosus]
MNLLLKNLLFTIFLLASSAGLIYWIEAEKEIEILCSMFSEGQSKDYVFSTLETANLLNVDNQTGTDSDSLYFSSSFNMGSTDCAVIFNESNLVADSDYTRHFHLTGMLTILALILSGFMALFQLLLFLGLPLGHFAWGGEYKILPDKLRYGSAFSSLLFVFILLLLWTEAANRPLLPQAYPFLGFLFLISSYLNANSRSKKEKWLGIPVAVLLYLCFLSLAML